MSLFHSKTVQALSAWLSLATLGFTMLSRFAPEWFGALTWPQAILLGIGLALAAGLVLSFILAVGAYAFRLIRPLPSGSNDWSALPLLDHPAPILDEEALKKEMRLWTVEHVNGLFTLQAKIDDGHGKRMGAIEADLADWKGDADKTAIGFRTVFIALQAILARERLNIMSARIKDEGKVMLEALDNERELHGGAWQSWQHKLRNWEGALRSWCRIADAYFPDTHTTITTVHKSFYTEGDWHFEDRQFPDAKAVYIYQTFLAHFENWAKIQEEVQSRVHISAFGGPNALEVLADIGIRPALDGEKKAK
jgi:hypothetical protein